MNELVQIKNNGFSTNEERIITATNIFGGIEDLFKIKCNKERLDINHSKLGYYQYILFLNMKGDVKKKKILIHY